jgi:hypothetical protein
VRYHGHNGIKAKVIGNLHKQKGKTQGLIVATIMAIDRGELKQILIGLSHFFVLLK